MQSLSRIFVEDVSTDLNKALTDKNAELIDALLDELNLIGIARAFAKWEAGRAMTPGGVDYASAAMLHLRQSVANWVEEPNWCSMEEAYDTDPEILDAFVLLSEEHLEDHIIAAITAQLHLDIGWAARGNAEPDLVSNDREAVMKKHFNAARDIVTRFDPVAYDSPLLAEIQYRMCAGIDGGADRFEDAFLDWLELAPGQSAPYRTHGFYLLPRWFGDYEKLDQAARRVAFEAYDDWHAASYALLYYDVLREDPGSLERLDVAFFIKGMSEWLKSNNNDPQHVTAVLDQLYAVSDNPRRLLNRQPDWLVEQRTALREGMADLIDRHVTEFDPAVWSHGRTAYLGLLACAFQDDIEEGSEIVFSRDGVTLRPAMPLERAA